MADSPEPKVTIVKRRRVTASARHGGAWKVAYADFVTAMMAFFLLMWLISTTTESQRSGLADYFSPTIPLFQATGGGDGPFGGIDLHEPSDMVEAMPMPPAGLPLDPGLDAVLSALDGDSGDAVDADPLVEHIRTRLTDEGLFIEVFDLPSARLFRPGTTEPTAVMEQLTETIGRLIAGIGNRVAITGHLASQARLDPEAEGAWPLSSGRAERARLLLEDAGVGAPRVARVTGKGDTEPAFPARPTAVENNRIEFVLLRNPPGDAPARD